MTTDYHDAVRQIAQLQVDAVSRWHVSGIDNPYQQTSEPNRPLPAAAPSPGGAGRRRLLTDRILEIICRQHQFNYLLWHEEDIARSPDASDQQIAQVKRSIDRYNQQRNDTIEQIDEAFRELLRRWQVEPDRGARLNTETPGSAIDRLSILALRLYHLEEQLQRTDVTDEHRASVREKIAIGRQQHADLSCSLAELLEDIFAGRKRLKRYRQMKMYNDPALNPYLYASKHRRAG